MTRNDAEDRRLLRSFGLFGPPTFVFLKENSGELDNLGCKEKWVQIDFLRI